MAGVRQRRGMRAATVDRRERILDVAFEIFGSRGYSNSSLTEIAERVDMTHAGVLHHFGSKDALLLEVLRRRDEHDVANLDGQHMPGGVDLFRHLVRTAFVNAHRAGIVQAFAVLSAESVTEGNPGRTFFTSRFRSLRDDISHAFGEMCAELGVPQSQDVAAASAAIVAVMDGLQVQWLLDPDRIDLGRASAYAIEAIVASVVHPHVDVLGPRGQWPASILEGIEDEICAPTSA